MKLTQEELGNGVLKLTPVGAMDVAGSAFLDPAFSMVAEQSKRIIVDLSGVDFLASIGVRILVKTAKTVAATGGRMAVFSPQDTPRKVIEATGVDRIVDLVADEAEAIAAVKKFDAH